MQISLKPGERLFLNGAVIRVDRRVTVELMNDVAFLWKAMCSRSRTPPRRCASSISWCR